MDYIIINENKVKINLNQSDMIKYSLLGIGDDYNQPRVRRAFKRIFEIVSQKSGFEFNSGKMLIQFYEGKDGCEIFVTKLRFLPKETEAAIKNCDGVSLVERAEAVYRFEKIEDFLLIRDRIKSPHSLFTYKNKIYLLIETDSLCDYLFLSEFSESVSALAISVLREHGETLSDTGLI